MTTLFLGIMGEREHSVFIYRNKQTGEDAAGLELREMNRSLIRLEDQQSAARRWIADRIRVTIRINGLC